MTFLAQEDLHPMMDSPHSLLNAFGSLSLHASGTGKAAKLGGRRNVCLEL